MRRRQLLLTFFIFILVLVSVNLLLSSLNFQGKVNWIKYSYLYMDLDHCLMRLRISTNSAINSLKQGELVKAYGDFQRAQETCEWAFSLSHHVGLYELQNTLHELSRVYRKLGLLCLEGSVSDDLNDWLLRLEMVLIDLERSYRCYKIPHLPDRPDNILTRYYPYIYDALYWNNSNTRLKLIEKLKKTPPYYIKPFNQALKDLQQLINQFYQLYGNP